MPVNGASGSRSLCRKGDADDIAPVAASVRKESLPARQDVLVVLLLRVGCSSQVMPARNTIGPPVGETGADCAKQNRLRRAPIGAISGCSGSLRLAAQDVALSRRKQGFESPRERQHFQKCSTKSVALPRPSDVLARLIWTLAFLVRAIQPG